MLLPDAGNAANSRGNSPPPSPPLSFSHSPQARRFGVAFGYLWQELLLPPEVVTRQQQQGSMWC